MEHGMMHAEFKKSDKVTHAVTGDAVLTVFSVIGSELGVALGATPTTDAMRMYAPKEGFKLYVPPPPSIAELREKLKDACNHWFIMQPNVSKYREVEALTLITDAAHAMNDGYSRQ